MHSIKRVLIILTIMLGTCSCGKDNKIDKYDEYHKVANNLYEVIVDDYDYDYLLNDGYGNVDFVAGCSAIKEGNYLGRNFDYVASDAAEIVVRTAGKEGRYASVGMVGGLLWLTSDFMDSGLDEDAKKVIPLMLLDGINEKGLAIEINCVNSIDVGGSTMSTNPGKKKVAQLCVVRYLLDNAASADEAVELMKNIDIVNPRDLMGLISKGFEVHFLITDKDKTYVVEFDNTMPEGKKLVVMEGESVMTNFYLHKADVNNNVYPENSMGVERCRKLVDNRKTVNSMDSMKELMQSIRFSNSNRTDNEYDPGENFDNPYTCFSDHPVFDENVINYGNYKEHISEILDTMKKDEASLSSILKDPNLDNPNYLWATTHNSVYDLENKIMSVSVFERYDTYYDYSVNN